MKRISLNDIKNEIKKSGASKGKFLYIREDSKIRVRFLTDFEDGYEIRFHDSFALGINVPCQEEFGRDCEYCTMEDLRTRFQYIWSVYDYESKEVKLLMGAVNNCSPVPALAALYDSYGTLLDRDLEIKRIGKGQNTTYSIVPLDKMKFRNEKVKPFSESAIKKILDKAYPADNSEPEEDERPKKKNNNLKGKMNEPEPDDWEEEEEKGTDYESMSAKELYNLCKEKGIEAKPRLKKEDYIVLLTEEEEPDDWEEDEEEDDEEEGLPFC